jgi:hypothetical protein
MRQRLISHFIFRFSLPDRLLLPLTGGIRAALMQRPCCGTTAA